MSRGSGRQAQAEELSLIGSDTAFAPVGSYAAFAAYDVDVIW